MREEEARMSSEEMEEQRGQEEEKVEEKLAEEIEQQEEKEKKEEEELEDLEGIEEAVAEEEKEEEEEDDDDDDDEQSREERIEELLEKPYWVVDILPEQVQAGAKGQFATIEKYFLSPERRQSLRRCFGEILLKLNCYFDMLVSFDIGESWEKNPEPEAFMEKLLTLPEEAFFRALFEEEETMMDMDGGDSWMAVYNPEEDLFEKLVALCAAQGLFVWKPER